MKKKNIPDGEKFKFSVELQLEILRFLVQDKGAFLIYKKVKSSYFTLIEHSLIMEGIIKFCKKYNKIPSKPLLKETCKNLLESKDYVNLVIKEDLPNINKCINDLYDKPLLDSDVIEENIYKFAAYIEMKSLNSSMDFTNFDTYEEYQNKIAKIIKLSKPEKGETPLFMVSDTVKRQLQRKADPNIVPTPYWQLNNLSNGQGYPQGSIFVILDKPKAKKTFSLINIARGYLSMKKTVLYIDTENGKKNIMERMVQSTLNRTKLDLISGDYDKLEKRHMRKYKKLGVEFIVERIPALVGDVNHIKSIIQEVETTIKKKIDILVIDYAAKLASIARDKEDITRINNVYIDLDNLGAELGLDAIWTAQHVTREAGKHKETRYEDNDIASSISIIRNAQCILGLNSTEEEEANNVQRLEVVVQRDGKPHGRCLFNVDLDRQRWKEFSKEARTKYDETKGKEVDQLINKKIKKGGNPMADKDKASNRDGDI